MYPIPNDPFDYLQFPKRRWRIVGVWKTGAEFLVTLGVTESDARRRLAAALAPYDAADRREIDCLWIERWRPGGRHDMPRWKSLRELDPRTWRRPRALRQLERAAR